MDALNNDIMFAGMLLLYLWPLPAAVALAAVGSWFYKPESRWLTTCVFLLALVPVIIFAFVMIHPYGSDAWRRSLSSQPKAWDLLFVAVVYLAGPIAMLVTYFVSRRPGVRNA
jgi:hypothetical protein